jgi:hypothetical protein
VDQNKLYFPILVSDRKVLKSFNPKLRTHPSARLVVVQVHEVPDVPLLPHDPAVRGVDEQAGKPHPVLQVVANSKNKVIFTANGTL